MVTHTAPHPLPHRHQIHIIIFMEPPTPAPQIPTIPIPTDVIQHPMHNPIVLPTAAAATPALPACIERVRASAGASADAFRGLAERGVGEVRVGPRFGDGVVAGLEGVAAAFEEVVVDGDGFALCARVRIVRDWNRSWFYWVSGNVLSWHCISPGGLHCRRLD